jgi:hypothetical protein
VLINGQRLLRNHYYKITHRHANAYAVLFDYIYHIRPESFPWITQVGMQESLFLTLDFLSPQLQPYNGLEIAAFSPYLVACYWLPGAKTKAKGFVDIGEYHVFLKMVNESKLTAIHLRKISENKLQLSEKSSGCAGIYLPCNLLHYRLFQDELASLIDHGLTLFLHQQSDLNLEHHLQEISKRSAGLSTSIVEKVKQLNLFAKRIG